jgi:carboxylesterase type B
MYLQCLGVLMSIGLARASAQRSAAPTVDLGYVKYTGHNNGTAKINYYRGIPYAQPPVGALRWQAPLPIEPLDPYKGGTFASDTIAPACYQTSDPSGISGLSGISQSEDCLYLDVLVPQNPVSKRLPVVVYSKDITAHPRNLC